MEKTKYQDFFIISDKNHSNYDIKPVKKSSTKSSLIYRDAIDHETEGKNFIK